MQLPEPCAEIEHIDHEIARLQARQLVLSTYVAAHKALISPIRQLPVDLVREIFVACIPTDSNAVMSAKEAPLLLGRICSSWRTIALSTPRLWSSIHIAVPHDKLPHHVHDGCLELVKEWLARSGGLPLSISFHRYPPPGSSPFFDAIVSFSSRWKHISVLGQQIRLSRANVPMLQSIEILDYAGGDESAETPDFLSGDAVRSVCLGTDLNPTQLPLPWNQLTVLSLDRLRSSHQPFPDPWSLTSSTALRILTQCQNLRECAISLSSGTDGTVEVSSSESVELPFLSSLSIFVAARRAFSPQHHDTLDRLRLPQLSSFSLSGPGFNHDSPGGFPFPTLISTATQLKRVEIDSLLLFTKEALITFMQLLPPSVQFLALRQCVAGTSVPAIADSDFLRSLIPPPSDETQPGAGAGLLLSQLDTLELHYSASFSDDELLRFVRARMDHHPLRRVHVKFYREAESDILPELRSFVGLDVSLEYNNMRPRNVWNPRDGLRGRYGASYR
ncbi:hypothetical protein MVEN_00349800 [Mycena venus]|uniref:F-box domain-containing protein n=1 Tax=Mycena venus TaxID=2733690 RepID=A0A8H7DAE6_9AGAR|nr:hypothetical protein MVEN_00349800 [Mycena venus]